MLRPVRTVRQPALTALDHLIQLHDAHGDVGRNVGCRARRGERPAFLVTREHHDLAGALAVAAILLRVRRGLAVLVLYDL